MHRSKVITYWSHILNVDQYTRSTHFDCYRNLASSIMTASRYVTMLLALSLLILQMFAMAFYTRWFEGTTLPTFLIRASMPSSPGSTTRHVRDAHVSW